MRAYVRLLVQCSVFRLSTAVAVAAAATAVVGALEQNRESVCVF